MSLAPWADWERKKVSATGQIICHRLLKSPPVKIIGSSTPLLQYLPFKFAKELQRSLFAYPIIMIRCALNGQWLMSLTRSLTQWSDINGHYHDDCLLRSNETFTNYLGQIVEKFKFKLDLENFAFLDTNWERPIFRSHQLVPCKDLGLMVCAVEGQKWSTY